MRSGGPAELWQPTFSGGRPAHHSFTFVPEPRIFYTPLTNGSRGCPSIAVKGESQMFDAKYNKLVDSTWFRIAMNSALFVAWIGAAYGTLAAR